MIGKGAWQAIYAMLRRIFNDIKTEILSTETSDFFKQIVFLRSFNSVFTFAFIWVA